MYNIIIFLYLWCLVLNYVELCLIMVLGALTSVPVICCSICPKVGAVANTATWQSKHRARSSEPVPRATVAGRTNQSEDDPNAQRFNAIQLRMRYNFLANAKKNIILYIIYYIFWFFIIDVFIIRDALHFDNGKNDEMNAYRRIVHGLIKFLR